MYNKVHQYVVMVGVVITTLLTMACNHTLETAQTHPEAQSFRDGLVEVERQDQSAAMGQRTVYPVWSGSTAVAQADDQGLVRPVTAQLEQDPSALSLLQAASALQQSSGSEALAEHEHAQNLTEQSPQEQSLQVAPQVLKHYAVQYSIQQ